MQVVLLKEVRSIGHSGDVLEVSDGYARNYLLPQRLAVAATKELLIKVAKERQEQKEKNKVNQHQLSQTASKINKATISLEMRASENGNLYGSVTIPDIIKHAKLQLGVDLQAAHFTGYNSIKDTGNHKVQLKIDNSLINLNVNVRGTA